MRLSLISFYRVAAVVVGLSVGGLGGGGGVGGVTGIGAGALGGGGIAGVGGFGGGATAIVGLSGLDANNLNAAELSAGGLSEEPPVTPGLGFINPAGSGEFLSTFNPPAPGQEYDAGFHRGVDITVPDAGSGLGSIVVAPGSGVVTFAGVVAGKPMVSITHPGGIVSSFEPLEAMLPKGAAVTRGDVIGVVGTWPETTAAHCDYPCVHWGVHLADAKDTYLDPLVLLNPPLIVLLPLRPEVE